MVARVDFEARTIHGGIRELVLAAQPWSRQPGGFLQLRAEIGRDIHRAYQARRASTPGFAAEVAVALYHELDGFTATLRGRIDSLVDDGETLTVEEIKSLSPQSAGLAGLSDAAALASPEIALYGLQARLYALALTASHPDRAVAVKLVLVAITDTLHQPGEDSEPAAQRVLDVPFDASATRAELDGLLRAVLDEAAARDRRARERALWAGALRFPYPAPWPQQIDLMDRITDAMTRGRPVLASAPTGTGKTVSALLPALRFALASDRPVFFATAKTTQRAEAARAFADIAAASGLAPGTISAVTLRARPDMCPPGHLVCHPEHCSYLARFVAPAPGRPGPEIVVDALFTENVHVAPDRIYAAGEAAGLCPFELSADAAARADLVICDYNHVYEPENALVTVGAGSGRAAPVVIVDEAHNLLDRARDYESCFLSLAELAAADRFLAGQAPRAPTGPLLVPAEALYPGRASRPAASPWQDIAASDQAGQRLRAALVDLLADVGDVIEQATRAALGPLHVFDFVAGTTQACPCCGNDPAVWRDLASRATRLAWSHTLYWRSRDRHVTADPVLDVLARLVRIRDGVASGQAARVPYVATASASGGPGFGALCLDPAELLARRHGRAGATVAMSATLEPLGYFADVLGFGGLGPVCIRVSSPFPAEHRRVVIVPTVDTRYRERARHYRTIAELITAISAVRPGKYAAFFPSFAMLGKVRAHLGGDSAAIHVQLPDMPAVLRDRMLTRFRTGAGPALLLAVMGGIFAEGIDLPGDQLIGAIIVGPGLPAVGFERVMMQRYFDDACQSGFDYAMLYPGMQRVVQAAGRVIRSASDRGVIALLDRRFARERYAACLPADWHRGDVGELVTEDPAAELARFWLSADDP